MAVRCGGCTGRVACSIFTFPSSVVAAAAVAVETNKVEMEKRRETQEAVVHVTMEAADTSKCTVVLEDTTHIRNLGLVHCLRIAYKLVQAQIHSTKIR